MSKPAGKKRGCGLWALVTLALIGLAGFGIYRWAVGSQSVATLDRIDSVLGPDASVARGQFAFGDDPAQRLHVFTPRGSQDDAELPVVIFIHGGGWQSGDPADYAFAGRRLAEMGYVAVLPGYRLGPDGAFPAMLEDGAAALRWTRDNISRFSGDPARLHAMGHSAGAYNAVMLALDPQWLAAQGLPADTLKSVIGLAGPYDFLPLDGESVEIAFGKVEPSDVTQPVNFVRPDAPPLLLLTGTLDTVVEPRNSRSLAEAMTRIGGRVKFQEFPGMDHVDILTALARPFSRDSRVVDAMAAFLPDPGTTSERDASVPVQRESR